jgi:hypothetical protein
MNPIHAIIFYFPLILSSYGYTRYQNPDEQRHPHRRENLKSHNKKASLNKKSNKQTNSVGFTVHNFSNPLQGTKLEMLQTDVASLWELIFLFGCGTSKMRQRSSDYVGHPWIYIWMTVGNITDKRMTSDVTDTVCARCTDHWDLRCRFHNARVRRYLLTGKNKVPARSMGVIQWQPTRGLLILRLYVTFLYMRLKGNIFSKEEKMYIL